MITYHYACRTCRRRILLNDEDKAMRWWLKHEGHERTVKIIDDTPERKAAPTVGTLAFCPRCKTGEHFENFENDYPAWSDKHQRCR